MPDDELTFTIGAREIYDAVQKTSQHVEALREDRASERVDRERRDAHVDRRLGTLERWRWEARGALGLAAVALGWLIEARVIHK